ncbi:aminoglycoside phosphotransferase family protein [Streptomyces clavifer]|uniref:aminoglycoside phosphotransferase family protein n=1 Tax=Streptomyces clavifer TaxID=68188 RepID=UPI0036C9BF62
MAHAKAFDGSVPVYRHMVRNESQRAWLTSLPGLVAEYEQRWGISTGAPYRSGTSAWVAPGTLPDGREAVLKIVWPHREAAGEAAGLRQWTGKGAVELYDSDAEHFALLLERCSPGTTLTDANLRPEDALTEAAEVLARLWSTVPREDLGLEKVADMSKEWLVEAEERRERFRPAFDRSLLEKGLGLLRTLPAGATRSVVVHGDFNPGNVIRSSREPWLAIDAKPMVGDPGIDPEPLVSQVDNPFAHSDPAAVLRRRYALVADIVGEPAERLIAWAFARFVQSALWCVAHGEDGLDDMADAAVLAGLIGV